MNIGPKHLSVPMSHQLNNIQPTCGQVCGIKIHSKHDMILPLCGVHGRDGHGAKGADGGTDGRVGSRGEGTWRGSHANGLPNKMSQETCRNMFIVFCSICFSQVLLTI